MKNLKLILVNKWHLHFPIGYNLMLVLVLLFLKYSNLRAFETYIISFVLLFISCVTWELIQYRKLEAKDEPSTIDAIRDVVVGVLGGVFCILAFIVNIPYIVLITVNGLMVVLHIYKSTKE